MKPVSTNISFPELEEKVISFWRNSEIFSRSSAKNAAIIGIDTVSPEQKARPDYVFYDGPPFATGLPHYGHLLAGTIKDVVGRFYTMKGFHVDRRFGWDCHGVPVEFEVQKNLNLHGAKAIREYGVGKFNEDCRQIVLRYSKEWEKFVERSGRWVDFDRQYRTMDSSFMESVWWVFKQLWEKGLVKEGQKCVPYSWKINTPISNFEANLNYKNVQDPSVVLDFRVIESEKFCLDKFGTEKVSFYAWTTTPWTLPDNLALAVNPELTYVLVKREDTNKFFIIAKDCLKFIFSQLPKVDGKEVGFEIKKEFLGSELAGINYQPLFEYFIEHRQHNAFQVYTGDFVLAEEGTGVVHIASFGEDDLTLLAKNKIPIIDPVDEDGNFMASVPDFAGLNIKEADPKIIAQLKHHGLLVIHSTIEHSYPFCWRTDTPLIYKSISSWFVSVESFKEKLSKNNKEINWIPEYVKEGRFGKWLEGARDWAISRNRFWGTPIPIWKCKDCGQVECIGSVAELEKLSLTKVEDLHLHFIDNLKISCTNQNCQGELNRVSDVLDCWFESGSMPYAQEHYPFENQAKFEANFPGDFIAEGLDQTRGWFYTLLVLSTALFDKPAFKNVIVNGIVLAEDGKKMSKSLKNYPPIEEVFSEFGADALRIYLLSSAATKAEDLRFSKAGVINTIRQTLLPLWNAYNFFVTYALVDGWSPSKLFGHTAEEKISHNIIDKWILAKLTKLQQDCDTALSGYKLYLAVPAIIDFIEQLTNWYIRLNRRRFWAGNTASEKQDKENAYNTLYTVLIQLCRIIAPIAPFISEEIFKNLSDGTNLAKADSVHMTKYPEVGEFSTYAFDPELEEAMNLFEEVILLGRSLRNEHELKLRQPLAKLTVIAVDQAKLDKLKMVESYIKEELNVKEVFFTTEETKYVELSAKLNTKLLGKTLGPKLGSEGMAKLRGIVEALSTIQLRKIEAGEPINFEGIPLSSQELLIERKVKAGVDACASSGTLTIVYDTALTQELRLEGLTREFINRLQKARKDKGFQVSDRISVRYMTACPKLALSLSDNKAKIMEETLAVSFEEVRTERELIPSGSSTSLPMPLDVEGSTIILAMSVVQG